MPCHSPSCVPVIRTSTKTASSAWNMGPWLAVPVGKRREDAIPEVAHRIGSIVHLIHRDDVVTGPVEGGDRRLHVVSILRVHMFQDDGFRRCRSVVVSVLTDI